MNQLTIFDIQELTVDEDQLERDAMIYTVRSIMHSDSNRNLIKGALKAGDLATAFDWFHNSTRTYGFGGKKYNFSLGRIRIEGNHEFKVTSRQLFNLLLELVEKGEVKL